MLKSCIVHNTNPSNCNCPDSLSQLDKWVVEDVIDRLPDDPDSKGPFRRVTTTQRKMLAGMPLLETSVRVFSELK